jgi:hypothetical protein
MNGEMLDPSKVCCDGSDEKAHAKHLDEQRRAKDKGEGEDAKPADKKDGEKKDGEKKDDSHDGHNHDGAGEHREGARQ